MAKHCLWSLLLGAAVFTTLVQGAVPPSETLLPATTKGYVSIPDLDVLSAQWRATQLGQLVEDPIMQPFVDDLKRQIKNKLNKTRVRLGIGFEDLDGVAAGEVCLAAVQPGGDRQQHANVLLVDVTERGAEAAAMLARIEQNLLEQGATKRSEAIGETPVTVFVMPKKRPENPTVEARYAVHRDLLMATDHAAVLASLVARLNGEVTETLSAVEAFAATMRRVEKEAGDLRPHIRWFVEPFGYAHFVRATNGGRKRRGADLLKVLENQGFDAIQGVGGWVNLATGDQEFLYSAHIYAPPVAPAEGETRAERYRLAARMLDFPNSEDLQPQPWISRDLGAYLTFNWKMTEAFEYSKTLVNELMGAKEGQDLFEDMIGSLANDKDGPQIDLREDLTRYLAERASLVADCRRPITPDSERLMFAIELNDAEAVRASVDKAMEADPDAQRRDHQGHVIWEILTDAEPAEIEPLQIDGGGFDPFGGAPVQPDAAERERVFPNSAITVANGHLIVATHIDFIVELLDRPIGVDTLAEAVDYRTVVDALQKLGAGEDSFHFFTRTDEAYRATYELIRQGRMPEAKSLFGKLLNRLLGPDEEGILREQQIDGEKLPAFDAVRRYLGPAGLYVRSEEQGWYICGCLLSKEME